MLKIKSDLNSRIENFSSIGRDDDLLGQQQDNIFVVEAPRNIIHLLAQEYSPDKEQSGNGSFIFGFKVEAKGLNEFLKEINSGKVKTDNIFFQFLKNEELIVQTKGKWNLVNQKQKIVFAAEGSDSTKQHELAHANFDYEIEKKLTLESSVDKNMAAYVNILHDDHGLGISLRTGDKILFRNFIDEKAARTAEGSIKFDKPAPANISELAGNLSEYLAGIRNGAESSVYHIKDKRYILASFNNTYVLFFGFGSDSQIQNSQQLTTRGTAMEVKYNKTTGIIQDLNAVPILKLDLSQSAYNKDVVVCTSKELN